LKKKNKTGLVRTFHYRFIIASPNIKVYSAHRIAANLITVFTSQVKFSAIRHPHVVDSHQT